MLGNNLKLKNNISREIILFVVLKLLLDYFFYLVYYFIDATIILESSQDRKIAALTIPYCVHLFFKNLYEQMFLIINFIFSFILILFCVIIFNV